MWKIFHKSHTNRVRFDELVQCLECIGTWIQSKNYINREDIGHTVADMFHQLNKNPDVDEFSEEEFIN